MILNFPLWIGAGCEGFLATLVTVRIFGALGRKLSRLGFGEVERAEVGRAEAGRATAGLADAGRAFEREGVGRPEAERLCGADLRGRPSGEKEREEEL